MEKNVIHYSGRGHDGKQGLDLVTFCLYLAQCVMEFLSRSCCDCDWGFINHFSTEKIAVQLVNN